MLKLLIGLFDRRFLAAHLYVLVFGSSVWAAEQGLIVRDTLASNTVTLRHESLTVSSEGGLPSVKSVVSIISGDVAPVKLAEFVSAPAQKIAQLSNIFSAYATGERIRAIVHWEIVGGDSPFPAYIIWDISYGDAGARLNDFSEMRFLGYKEDMDKARSTFEKKGDLAPDLSHAGILARGIAECQKVVFVDINTVEVIWKTGGKDLIRLSDPADGPGVRIVKVENAKQKIPGVDGVEVSWSPDANKQGKLSEGKPEAMQPDFVSIKSTDSLSKDSNNAKHELASYASESQGSERNLFFGAVFLGLSVLLIIVYGRKRN